MSSVSCSRSQKGDSRPVLAVINSVDNTHLTVDATGSVGDHVRVVIIRAGEILEVTPGEVNNGNNQIVVTIPLQNGDVVCVQASNTGFATLDEDCHTIPTPLFGFVPVS
jgi:hypothetical protein